MSETNNGRRDATIERNPAATECLRKYQEDYFWCLSQADLRQRYASQVVILHERRVIGHGETGAQAREAAHQAFQQRGEPFPSENDLLVVLMPPMTWLDEPVPGTPAVSSAQAASASPE